MRKSGGGHEAVSYSVSPCIIVSGILSFVNTNCQIGSNETFVTHVLPKKTNKENK